MANPSFTYNDPSGAPVVVNFLAIAFPVDRPGSKTADVTRPGVDGRAFKRQGTRGVAFSVNAVVDVVAADGPTLKTTIEAYKGLEGQLCTVVDDHQATWTNIMVTRVVQPAVRKITANVGGLNGSNATHLVRVQLSCVDNNRS